MKKLPVIIFVLFFLFTACENETQNTENNNTVFDNLTQQKNKTNKQKENIEFKASSENIVETGEIFRIKFEVNADAENFTPPDFEGIDVISGPATSSFSSIQIINGKSSRKYTTSYTYSVSCSEAGTVTVKPAEITVDGNVYKSNPLQIKVVNNTPAPKNANAGKNTGQQKITANDDIFIKTDFTDLTVYNGEFITATTKIYTRKDFQNISEIKFPDYSGFWTKKLKEPRRLEFHNELINGKKYSVALLKQVLLFAVKPGKYEITPYEISLQIRKKDGKIRDFFGNIVDNYKLINKRLKTKKQTITVKPLPVPVPEDFSGFTGKNVSLTAEIDTRNFRTDESASLKITVSGTGNLYLLNNFKLKLPEGLKTFKPETELKDKYTENGETGDKIFNFILVANKPGTYKIPAQKFIYFNGDKQKYDTVFTQNIEINVTGGGTYSSTVSSADTLSGKDIRYIKTGNVKIAKRNENFVGSGLYYLSYLFLIAAFIMLIVMRNKHIKENEDVISVKKKKAGKISQKRLKKALKYLNEKNDKDFYKEILNALWGYISDKTAVNADSLTKDGIKELLNEKNADENLTEKLLNLIEVCGYAQYSPSGEDTKPEKIYEDAENIINELETVL